MGPFDALLGEVEAFGLLTASLSSPTSQEIPAAKVTVRPTMIKGRQMYQVTRFVGAKAIHENISAAECVRLLRECVPAQYAQGFVETSSASYHLVVDKNGSLKVKRKSREAALVQVPVAHNKTKKYAFPEGTPVPFLVSLGIMKADGRVPRDRYDKFRQVNHFIELIDSALEALPKGRELYIVDFGSGKSYLTFALHYYLNHIKKRPTEITGIDLKKEVVEACQELATKLGETSLSFVCGDIKEFVPKRDVDMVITLHACNLATDAALVNAVAWKAAVILSVPCCQHELIHQVKCEGLDTLLRHGVLKERFAALVTDAMRADLLAAAGYAVDVIEFVDLEHTPKNLMIRAVRAPSDARARAAQSRYASMKALLHLSPWLENSLI